MSPLVSRRTTLSMVLASAALGCRSSEQPAPAAARSASPSSPAWGGLRVANVTQMTEVERGGVAVVLLHGFGASGDDLVSLAQALQRPQTRFFLPAAPLELAGGGRAWWQIDAADRPRYITDAPDVAPAAPNPALAAARGAVQGVLRTALERYAPTSLSIVGFSQGAMLALDVALAGAPAVTRVGVLSGALLVDAAARLEVARAGHPPVFISHGRDDHRLPFSGGERMKAALEAHGFPVTWRPFDGGHQIPRDVVSELSRFLFGA